MSSTLSVIDEEEKMRRRGCRIHSSLHRDRFDTWDVVQKTVKERTKKDCGVRDQIRRAGLGMLEEEDDERPDTEA